MTALLPHLDAWIAACLWPLAVVIVVSGLDDLFLVGVWAVSALRRRLAGPGLKDHPRTGAVRRIAIFVPLWHEHDVIGGMLDHNCFWLWSRTAASAGRRLS